MYIPYAHPQYIRNIKRKTQKDEIKTRLAGYGRLMRQRRARRISKRKRVQQLGEDNEHPRGTLLYGH